MRERGMKPDARLDIRREVCPMTFVRTKLALEQLPPGSVLEVLLQGDEPLRNVPGTARDEGHEVLRLEPVGDGSYRLWLRKGVRC
jgi:TusA-related sulfurtransferase